MALTVKLGANSRTQITNEEEEAAVEDGEEEDGSKPLHEDITNQAANPHTEGGKFASFRE